MQLHTIKRKTENKKKVSVGRGGKRGKTSGRGTKGQGARSGRKIRPEIRDAIKRIPKLRGRGKNSNLSIQTKPIVVSLSIIEKAYAVGETVNSATLVEKNLLLSYKGKIPKVKILAGRVTDKKAKEGNSDFTKKLNFSGIAMSESVKALIEKAGGTIN